MKATYIKKENEEIQIGQLYLSTDEEQKFSGQIFKHLLWDGHYTSMSPTVFFLLLYFCPLSSDYKQLEERIHAYFGFESPIASSTVS